MPERPLGQSSAYDYEEHLHPALAKRVAPRGLSPDGSVYTTITVDPATGAQLFYGTFTVGVLPASTTTAFVANTLTARIVHPIVRQAAVGNFTADSDLFPAFAIGSDGSLPRVIRTTAGGDVKIDGIVVSSGTATAFIAGSITLPAQVNTQATVNLAAGATLSSVVAGTTTSFIAGSVTLFVVPSASQIVSGNTTAFVAGSITLNVVPPATQVVSGNVTSFVAGSVTLNVVPPASQVVSGNTTAFIAGSITLNSFVNTQVTVNVAGGSTFAIVPPGTVTVSIASSTTLHSQVNTQVTMNVAGGATIAIVPPGTVTASIASSTTLHSQVNTQVTVNLAAGATLAAVIAGTVSLANPVTSTFEPRMIWVPPPPLGPTQLGNFTAKYGVAVAASASNSHPIHYGFTSTVTGGIGFANSGGELFSRKVAVSLELDNSNRVYLVSPASVTMIADYVSV